MKLMKKTDKTNSNPKSTEIIKKDKRTELEQEMLDLQGKTGQSILLQITTAYALYRKVIVMNILTTIAVLVSLVGLALFTTETIEPKYISVSENNMVVEDKPLDQEVITESVILTNALEVIDGLNNFDYLNWKKTLPKMQKYFEPNAWYDYQKSLNESKNMEAVKDGKRIVTVEVKGSPVVKKKINESQIFTWKVEVPVLITYKSHVVNKNDLNQEGLVEIFYQRAKLKDNPRQYWITTYFFKPNRTY